MVESLSNSIIDTIEDYLQNDPNLFNFENSLSKIQESGNESLPEGFEYDSDGNIICNEDLFTKNNAATNPEGWKHIFEKIIGGKNNEGKYRGINYSDCNFRELYDIDTRYGEDFLILKQTDGNLAIEGHEDTPILLLRGTKIIPPDNKYMEYIGYEGTDNISGRIDLVKNRLNYYYISFSDIKSFFGEDKTESEIFDILKNTNMYDDLDEQKGKQIFGEYSNEIQTNIIGGLEIIGLKNKIGDTLFYKYLGYFKENWGSIRHIKRYFQSPYCTITQNNMDEYLDYLSKGGNIDIGTLSLEEAKIVQKYNFSLAKASIYSGNLKEFETTGITKDMCEFCGSDIWVINELFIEEKEGINLFHFLSKYPQKLKDLGGKEIKEIELNANQRNFCFRGILEMIKSRGTINILPYPGEDANENELNEWKTSREKAIKEYESALRHYISLDNDESGNQKPKKETFDKIFYSMFNEEEGGWDLDFNKETLQNFSNNKILDYSNTIDENGNLDQSNGKKMIKKICKYAKRHKNEKILVFIAAHGGENGESGNGRTKEDWLTISKYPNIKIMTIRCFFGTAYNNDNDNESGDHIYTQQSQLSGFSNKSPTSGNIINYLRKGFDKGLGFYEMEIYARLNYKESVSPLTENSDGKITGLAYGGEGDTFDNII